MRLTNEFSVLGDRERVFNVLLDVPNVARCMPGAELLSSEGQVHHGRLRLKVGPVKAEYEGDVTLLRVERDAGVMALRAEGREQRGSGLAHADVTVTVESQGDRTKVAIDTELTIQGRVAQFGRSVLADVSQRIVEQFARNVEHLVVKGEAAVEAAQPGTETRLDVVSVVVVPLARRVVPVAAAFSIGLWLGRLVERRSERTHSSWYGGASQS